MSNKMFYSRTNDSLNNRIASPANHGISKKFGKHNSLILGLIYLIFVLLSLACGYGYYYWNGIPVYTGPDFGDCLLSLFIAIIIGLIPAAIAQSKGKDFITWWIFGAALFIVALPAALLAKKEMAQSVNPGSLWVTCRACGVINSVRNSKCEACGTSLPHAPSSQDSQETERPSNKCPRCGFENPLSAAICEKCMQLLRFE